MSDLARYIDQWGGIPFFVIKQFQEKENIYPDDWIILENYDYVGCIHKCIGIFEDYLIVEFIGTKIRIKESCFEIMPSPTFKPLEKVEYIDSKNRLQKGIIKRIYYHDNMGKYIYNIETNGKMKTRRYYADDLMKIKE